MMALFLGPQLIYTIIFLWVSMPVYYGISGAKKSVIFFKIGSLQLFNATASCLDDGLVFYPSLLVYIIELQACQVKY